jgi:hypothetical protein
MKLTSLVQRFDSIKNMLNTRNVVDKEITDISSLTNYTWGTFCFLFSFIVPYIIYTTGFYKNLSIQEPLLLSIMFSFLSSIAGLFLFQIIMKNRYNKYFSSKSNYFFKFVSDRFLNYHNKNTGQTIFNRTNKLLTKEEQELYIEIYFLEQKMRNDYLSLFVRDPHHSDETHNSVYKKYKNEFKFNLYYILLKSLKDCTKKDIYDYKEEIITLITENFTSETQIYLTSKVKYILSVESNKRKEINKNIEEINGLFIKNKNSNIKSI